MKRKRIKHENDRSNLIEGITGFLTRIFVQPGFVVALCAPIVALLMFWVFGLNNTGHPLSYAAYVASAWALVVFIVGIVKHKPWVAVSKKVLSCLPRFLAVRDNRTAMNLRVSFCIDVLWAIANTTVGIYTASRWFVLLGIYYLALACARLVVLIFSSGRIGSERFGVSRICGAIIAISSIVIAAIVMLVVNEEGSFSHREIIVYAMAVYAFYALGVGILNYLRFHSSSNPLMTCALNVNLVNALVTMFALEVAMITAFGTGEDAAFRFITCTITGVVVTILTLGIGVRLFCMKESDSLT